jgi:hypothetical protein
MEADFGSKQVNFYETMLDHIPDDNLNVICHWLLSATQIFQSHVPECQQRLLFRCKLENLLALKYLGDG